MLSFDLGTLGKQINEKVGFGDPTGPTMIPGHKCGALFLGPMGIKECHHHQLGEDCSCKSRTRQTHSKVQAGGRLFYGCVTCSVFYRPGRSGLGFLDWGHCNFCIWFTFIWFITTHFSAQSVGLSICFQKRSSECKYSFQSPKPHSAASVRRAWAKRYGKLRGNHTQGKSQMTCQGLDSCNSSQSSAGTYAQDLCFVISLNCTKSPLETFGICRGTSNNHHKG